MFIDQNTLVPSEQFTSSSLSHPRSVSLSSGWPNLPEQKLVFPDSAYIPMELGSGLVQGYCLSGSATKIRFIFPMYISYWDYPHPSQTAFCLYMSPSSWNLLLKWKRWNNTEFSYSWRWTVSGLKGTKNKQQPTSSFSPSFVQHCLLDQMMYSTPKHSYGKKIWRIVIKIDFFPLGSWNQKWLPAHLWNRFILLTWRLVWNVIEFLLPNGKWQLTVFIFHLCLSR